MYICPRDACTLGTHFHKAKLDPIRLVGQDEDQYDLGEEEVCDFIPAEPEKSVYCSIVLSIRGFPLQADQFDGVLKTASEWGPTMGYLEGATVDMLPELMAQYMVAAAEALVEDPKTKWSRRSPSGMSINAMDHDELGMPDRVLLHTLQGIVRSYPAGSNSQRSVLEQLCDATNLVKHVTDNTMSVTNESLLLNLQVYFHVHGRDLSGIITLAANSAALKPGPTMRPLFSWFTRWTTSGGHIGDKLDAKLGKIERNLQTLNQLVTSGGNQSNGFVPLREGQPHEFGFGNSQGFGFHQAPGYHQEDENKIQIKALVQRIASFEQQLSGQHITVAGFTFMSITDLWAWLKINVSDSGKCSYVLQILQPC